MSCLNDNAMGPAVQGCRGEFDFTILFENVVFTILPSSIFILLALIDILRLLRRPPVVATSYLLPVKILLACSCACLKLGVLILSSDSTVIKHLPWINAAATRAAAAVDFVAALAMVPLCALGHSRSPRPSITLSGYLLVTVLFDIAFARTVWLLVPSSRMDIAYPRLITAGAVLKAALLVAESYQKGRWLLWDRKHVSPEETSGIYSLSVFAWLNRLFLSGYRGLLTIEHLYPLDKSLEAESLSEQFTRALRDKGRLHGQKQGLAWLLARVLWLPMLLPLVPRTLFLGANFCQPLLVQALLNYLQQDDQDPRAGYALIAATALTYAAIATSGALYWYTQERFIIIIRGCLVLSIYEKTTELSASETDDSGVLTLMSTDVERVLNGMLQLHEYWAQCIQVALACYLLYKLLGSAFVAPFVVVALTAVAASFLGKMAGPRQKAWMESIQIRVAVTAHAIGNMKLIKMAGIAMPVQNLIQELRIKELRSGGRWRAIAAIAGWVSQIPTVLSPVVTFAFTPRTLDTSTIFVSISYLTLLTAPLMQLFQAIPQFLAALTCLQRIQSFLERDSRVDYRIVTPGGQGLKEGIPVRSHGDEVELGTIDTNPSGASVTIANASFGWRLGHNILTNVNVTIPSFKLTIVTGPVASGKSTLCKALLGEIPFAYGRVSLSRGTKVGYCDQQPFLYNDTIRANILGFEEFSMERYHKVVEVTMLHQDFAAFPKGDQTLIGSGGIALSGGQRQRVSIARALYQTGIGLLIFDDILSGLDVNTEDHVFRRVFGADGLALQSGATVVLCTHNTRRLAFAHHIIRLESEGTATEEDQEPMKEKQDRHLHFDGVPLDAVANLPPASMGALQSATGLSLEDAGARQVGDIAVYKHYVAIAKRLHILLFLICGIGYGFFSNYPRIWLTYWSDDATRAGGPSHSRAYWVGIYLIFQVLCSINFVGSAFVILGPFVGHIGSVLHQRALYTVINAPLRFFTTTDTGLVTNYFSQDMTLIDGDLPEALINVFLNMINVIGMAALLAASAPWLTLSYPALLAIMWLIQRFYLRTSRQLRLLDLEAKSPLYTNFLDTVRGVMTIRAFGWMPQSKLHNKQLLDRSQKPMYLLAMIQRWLNLILSLVVTVVATVLVALVTQLRAGAGVSGASLVTLMMLSQVLMYSVRFYAAMETSIGAVTRLRNFGNNTTSEQREMDKEPSQDWPRDGRIELRDVWASYSGSADECVLRGVDVTIPAGEKVAICGRTGSGKSSLILLLLGLLDPLGKNDDHVYTLSIDGQPLIPLRRQAIRERLITVPQDPVFLPSGSTVAQNVDPLATATPEQCQAALEAVGLWPAVQDLGGLQAELRDDAAALSHGQRQLFALARAVLKRRVSRAAVLLLDEFTSSVDAVTERAMMDTVGREFEGCTILMISHRLEVAKGMFDRVVEMENGRIVERRAGLKHM